MGPREQKCCPVEPSPTASGATAGETSSASAEAALLCARLFLAPAFWPLPFKGCHLFIQLRPELENEARFYRLEW